MHKLLFILFLSFPALLFSQNEMKYKDVMEIVESGDDVVAYQTINAYVSQCVEPEPELINAYYRLALICYSWANSFDPLKETHDVLYFTERAIQNLDSAKVNMNEKKFNKTRKYFTKLSQVSESKLKPDDILADIAIKRDSISNFKLKITNVVTNFNASADKYSKCLTIFRDINAKYSELNDVFMMYDDSLEAQISNLNLEFDSTLYYFDKYKEALAKYPLKAYNQNYKLRPIQIYRLDGLTASSFFDDEIQIWNYRQWTSTLDSVLAGKIKPLRELIAAANRNIKRDLKLAESAMPLSKTHKTYELEAELMYAISRFDSRHLIFDLFRYKQEHIKLLTILKDTAQAQKLSADAQAQRKARYYYELLMQKQLCDSLLVELKSESVSNRSNYKKYEELFNLEFENLNGLIAYEDEQLLGNQSILDANFKKYHSEIQDFEDRLIKKDSFILYNSSKIPLFINEFDLEAGIKGNYYTKDISGNRVGETYISGYQQYTETDKRAFILKLDDTQKLSWIKYYNYRAEDGSTADDFALKIAASETDCFVLIHSKGGASLQNRILKINASGRVQMEQKLEEKRIPADVYVDDVSETVLLSFKGFNTNTGGTEEELKIYAYTTQPDKSLWQTDLKLTGELVDIVKVNENYMAVCNYKSYIDKAGDRQISKTGLKATNTVSAIFTTNGILLHNYFYESEKPMTITKVTKINSETIEFTGDIGQDKQFLYMITDKNGKLIFRNDLK